MVCFSSYALITEQAAAEDVRFFGQKAFGSVGSREREKKRHISNVPLQGSSTIYLVVAKLAAHAHRKLSAVVQKSFARRSFFTYAVCYMYRQSSDVHWQQQQRSDCTQQYQQQSKAERSKQANERTNERSNVRHRRRIFMTMAQFIYRSAL